MIARALMGLTCIVGLTTLAHAYGAYAVGRSPNGANNGHLSWNAPTQNDADQSAMAGCNKAGNSNCVIFSRFSRSCIASVRSRQTGQEFLWQAPTEREAEYEATLRCNAVTAPQMGCFTLVKRCDTGTVVDTTQPHSKIDEAKPQLRPPPQATRQSETDTLVWLFSPIVVIGTLLVIFIAWKYWPQQGYQEEKLPPPRDPNSIPTPEERKKAFNHLRVAHSYFEEAFSKAKDHNEQAGYFEQAARSLVLARSLDPNARIDVQEDKEVRSYSIDELGARVLYYESATSFGHAEKLGGLRTKHLTSGTAFTSEGKLTTKRLDREIAEAKQLAVAPAEKAVKYQPYNTFYLAHLIRVYQAVGRHQHAKDALDRALKLDPDNIELLKLSQF